MAAATAMAVVLGSTVYAVSASSRQGAAPDSESNACTARAGPATKIGGAELFIEYNSTDGDVGVHGEFDDDGWKTLCVFDPTGRPILEVSPQGELRDLTMAQIFFESREPPSSEFSFAELHAAFPEGKYAVRGETFDGKTLVGNATFTHDVPAPPTITSPQIADDPKGTKENRCLWRTW